MNLNACDVTSVSLALAHWPIVVAQPMDFGGGTVSGSGREIRESEQELEQVEKVTVWSVMLLF